MARLLNAIKKSPDVNVIMRTVRSAIVHRFHDLLLYNRHAFSILMSLNSTAYRIQSEIIC